MREAEDRGDISQAESFADESMSGVSSEAGRLLGGCRRRLSGLRCCGDGRTRAPGKVDLIDNFWVLVTVILDGRSNLLANGGQAAAGGVNGGRLLDEGPPEQVVLAFIPRGESSHEPDRTYCQLD